MLRHKLLEPIKRDYKEIEFAKYVEIHRQQTNPTDKDLADQLKDEFYASHESVEQAKLDKIWKFVGPKVEANAGLAEFIRDYQGHKSEYFFPWLVNVFRSPATALEISYGAGPNLNGDWYEDILDTDDPIVPFIKDDPAFVYNRERQLIVADLASSIQDIGARELKKRPLKIVDFGAGRLAWIRRHGFSADPGLVQIYAFDRDPSIKPEQLFDEDLESLGVHFKHGDFTAQFNNPDCREADLIILGGVASYIPTSDFSLKIIPAIYNLLNPGGVFFFDLQIDCPCYQHSIDILDWPEFDLPASVSAAVDRVETIRKSLWLSGLTLNAEYQVDTYNKISSAVMITMQKIV